MTIMSNCIQRKTVSINRNLSYITKSLACLIKGKSLSTKRPSSPALLIKAWETYNRVRNKLTFALFSAKRDFLNKPSEDIKHPRDF